MLIRNMILAIRKIRDEIYSDTMGLVIGDKNSRSQ